MFCLKTETELTCPPADRPVPPTSVNPGYGWVLERYGAGRHASPTPIEGPGQRLPSHENSVVFWMFRSLARRTARM